MSREKIAAALQAARREHDARESTDGQAVINGALIRAVELLAARETQPLSPAEQFDGNLVERLAARLDPHDPPSSKGIARDAVAFILAELAKTPVELPTADDIYTAWNEKESPTTGTYTSVTMMLRARITPILAAKDAEIARLSADIRNMNGEWFAQKQRIAELEKQLSDSKAQHEADIVRYERERQTTFAPLDATGKTPGRVMTEKAHELFYAPDKPEAPFAWDRLSKSEQRRANETAQAVLRAFGPRAAEKALQSLRNSLAFEDDPSGYFRGKIDAELEQLAPASAKPFSGWDHPHEVGSCSHCDAPKKDAT